MRIATGRFCEGGRIERPGRGSSLIRHAEAKWEIEGALEVHGDAPVRFSNRYQVEPPRGPGDVINWRSHNPSIGMQVGLFTVAEEGILSLLQSMDKAQAGSETPTRVPPERYQLSGTLAFSGVLVSIRSMVLGWQTR